MKKFFGEGAVKNLVWRALVMAAMSVVLAFTSCSSEALLDSTPSIATVEPETDYGQAIGVEAYQSSYSAVRVTGDAAELSNWSATAGPALILIEDKIYS